MLNLSLPMMLGIISMVAFNLVDTYYVGKLGKDELAALSFTFPVILVIFNLVQGIGIGATALISKSIGEGNRHKAAIETSNSMMLGLILAGIFVVIGLLFTTPIFKLIGATDTLMPLIKEYMQVWFFTIMFVVVPFIGNSAIRATGDAKTPALIMLFAVVVNAILDPMLIFGYGIFPAMGLKGAAIATATSRALTFFLSIYILYKREKLLVFNFPGFKAVKDCWKAILYIGLPSGLAKMLTPLAQSVLFSLIAVYGTNAVAGYGVGTRIEVLAMSLLFAVSASIGPFAGQNLGANKFGRIETAVKYGSSFSIIWSLFAAVLLFVFAEPMASLFSNNEAVIEQTAVYLRLVPFSFGFQGVVLIVNANLNTTNYPLQASLLIALQMFVFYVPLAYLGSKLNGISGIFTAVAISYVLGGILSYLLNTIMMKKLKLKMQQSN